MNREENNQENNHLESIRDIEVSERRQQFDNRISHKETQGGYYKSKNKKKWPKVIIFLVLIGFILGSISFAFHRAEIIVTPKTEVLVFSNDVYRATVSENVFVKKADEENSGKISEGKIRIINQTGQTQKLRRETRFQTEDGLIYKIYSGVSIAPGKSIVSEAYSDGTGLKYNQKKGVKLIIPGFKEAKMDNEFKKIIGEIEEDFKTSDKDLEKPAVENRNEENNLEQLKKAQGAVKYKVFEIKTNLSEEVESIGAEEVSEKAAGKLKITNNTSKVQKLRKETRFRAEGMIFKTYKSVTIPAKSSVIAEAFADLPGEKFNIKKGIKMDVPGFEEAKMDNEFKNIFAVSETDFSGGIEGKILVPNKDKLEEVKKELEERAKKELKEKIAQSVSRKDYIFIDEKPFISINYKTESTDNKIILKIEAVAKIPIIAQKDFIALILKSEEIKQEDINSLAIDNLSDLEFNIINSDSFNIDSGSDFLISVKGEAKIYWVLDKDLLIKSIKGNSLDEINEKLKNSFKNFEFNISTSPFWRYSIPANSDDIEIVINN